MTIPDRTVCNAINSYYNPRFYQMKKYYYLNTIAQLILLFLGREMRPISCLASRINMFLFSDPSLS